MHQEGPKNRATPPRRRQNRQSTNSPADKSYASENDMAAGLQFPLDLACGTPNTPLKSASNSPAPEIQASNSKSKPRNANRARPKHVSTSPRPVRPGHNTPPNTGLSKTSSATAFAGATFHASPAPSSLPIPSFLSKAMDSPGIKYPGRVDQGPSPPPTDSEAPTPQHLPSTSMSAMQESPLDVFFRADRAEKELAHRTKSTNALAAIIGPLSPPMQTGPLRGPDTAPGGPGARQGSVHRGSAAGISTMELDGTPGRPMGPAFSTPYHDRIRAARSNENQGGRSPTAVHQHGAPVARSEALKKFLALGSASPSELSYANGPRRPSTSTSQDLFSDATLPHARQAGIASPSKQDSDQSQELQQMEANLRRILKLDAGPGLEQAPTIADSRGS